MSDATTIDVTNQAPAPRVVATIEPCPEWCVRHRGGLDSNRSHESASMQLYIASEVLSETEWLEVVAQQFEGIEFGRGVVTRDHTRFEVYESTEQKDDRGQMLFQFDNAEQMRDFAAGLNKLADSIGGTA